jgi:hypothetical protein
MDLWFEYLVSSSLNSEDINKGKLSWTEALKASALGELFTNFGENPRTFMRYLFGNGGNP